MPRVTITVPEKNAQPYRFQLDREVVTLGRGDENDIAIDSGSVSVNHAEMRRIKGGYELVDIGSTNGIKLDGHRYEVIPLSNDAFVTIGDVIFGFLLSDEELATLAKESTPALSPIHREEEIPKSGAKPTPKRPVYHPQKASSGGGGAMFVFFLLAIAAFFAGMVVRYQKETGGGSLIEAIKVHHAAKPGATPAPATPVAPATAPATPEPPAAPAPEPAPVAPEN